jgi:Family of unknown function (DUF6496)
MPVLKKKPGESVAQQHVRSAMHERKRGKLRSGSKTGPKVTNPAQAIAIGLSGARRAGAAVPKKKATRKKRPAKK